MKITIDDFNKVEIRAGRIIDVQDFFEARKPLYKLTIDFGKFGIKQSGAGLRESYKKEELLDRQVVAVVNFPPRQIKNFMSECLVLGLQKGKRIVLLKPDEDVELGEKVF